MTRPTWLESLLFWTMVLVGTAVLAPCLILPPWLEYQAQLDRRRAADQYVAALQAQLNRTNAQIDHLENDPAYLLRLAEQELGDDLDLPPQERIAIAPDPETAADTPPLPQAPDATASQESIILPELATFVDRALDRYPYTRLFVAPHTRPPLMILGAALLLGALTLLGLSHRPARQDS